MKAYKSYECIKCKKTTIVITEEVNKKGYIVCSHCSSKKIKAIKEVDNLKECMSHSSYKKEHGALRQVR